MKVTMKITAVMLLLAAANAAYGEDDKKLTVDVGADVVSSYVWRGQYQTGVSFQPSLSASWSGLTLGVWGSTDFSIAKEFDFTLSYEIGGLSVGITDYWIPADGQKEGMRYFGYAKEQHLFEGNISYHFGDNLPLSLGWNTVFYGDQDLNEEDKRMYSSYFTVGYDFTVKGAECTAEVGVNPWASQFHDEFNVMSLSLTAKKSIAITSEFSLPVFVQMIFAPAKNDAHLVFGITF